MRKNKFGGCSPGAGNPVPAQAGGYQAEAGLVTFALNIH